MPAGETRFDAQGQYTPLASDWPRRYGRIGRVPCGLGRAERHEQDLRGFAPAVDVSSGSITVEAVVPSPLPPSLLVAALGALTLVVIVKMLPSESVRGVGSLVLLAGPTALLGIVCAQYVGAVQALDEWMLAFTLVDVLAVAIVLLVPWVAAALAIRTRRSASRNEA